MSDYRRSFQPGGTYFFTVVTEGRHAHLGSAAAVDRLRNAFRQVRINRPFEIDAVVILPDHLHAIWRLPEGDADFSTRWRLIKRYFSLGFEIAPNERSEKRLWQRRFWEHLLRDETDWRRHMDYVHYNPVKHGYVRNPVDWPWTSFHRLVEAGWYEVGWGRSAPASVEGMEFE